ncbi:hypothetical protein [Bradyrhizobium sp. SZCCHNS1012]|uniref:hypothetical protein n=1 Tax=Bradyrhizobium sp. SZCCHNS1012 TaxID=3057297 RepID=UPI00291641A7|nr:hypothetical protein [Bradyrhizobium sp. SZCCHNS1012]
MHFLKSRYIVGLALAFGSSLLIATSGMLPLESPTSPSPSEPLQRPPPTAATGAYAQAPSAGRYGTLLFKEQLEQNTRDLQLILTNLSDIRNTSEFQSNPRVQKAMEKQIRDIRSAVAANQKMFATFDRYGGRLIDQLRPKDTPVGLAGGGEVQPAAAAWIPLAQFTTGIVGLMLSLFVTLFGNDHLSKARARRAASQSALPAGGNPPNLAESTAQ